MSGLESAQRRSEKTDTLEASPQSPAYAEAPKSALHFENVVRDIERYPTAAETPPPYTALHLEKRQFVKFAEIDEDWRKTAPPRPE
jgi:hypothetical protein